MSRATVDERIEAFLAEGPWAVVGASADRAKFGNQVLRCYQRHGKAPVYPVNPSGGEIEGLTAYASLSDLPETARAVSIITPPAVTEHVVAEALRLGIEHLWMQPGAESRRALELAEEAGVEAIAGGPCLLVVLG